MNKRLAYALAIGFLLAVGIVALILFQRWGRSVPSLPPPDQDYAYLPVGDEGIVGDWNQVGTSIYGDWQKFSASGKMLVCHGDLIESGTYELLDGKTLLIRKRGDPYVERWTIAFINEKLVMANKTAGWVNEYRRIAPGKLVPEVGFEE